MPLLLHKMGKSRNFSSPCSDSKVSSREWRASCSFPEKRCLRCSGTGTCTCGLLQMAVPNHAKVLMIIVNIYLSHSFALSTSYQNTKIETEWCKSVVCGKPKFKHILRYDPRHSPWASRSLSRLATGSILEKDSIQTCAINASAFLTITLQGRPV